MKDLAKKFEVPSRPLSGYVHFMIDQRPALMEQAKKELGDGGGTEGNMKGMSWIEKQAAEKWANVDAATKARYEPTELRENFDEEMKAFIDSGRKAEYDGKAVKEAIQDRKYWRIFL